MGTISKLHPIDIEVVIKRRTDRAVLVDDGDIDVWLPLSMIELVETANRKSCILTLPEQLAVAKGLV